jgi:hypothetical protein
MKIMTAFLVAGLCLPCIEWTRLSGKVKIVNLKAGTVTLQDRDGNLLTVPIDYQVTIVERHGETRTLKSLQLDEKVTLTRVQSEAPREDSEGLQPPPEPSQRGR